MSKKLVKTAKQQFEERLKELGNHVPTEINGETFHSGIDKDGHFHILRIGDADIEYSEFDYGCPLLELYENEEFLDKISAEFAIAREGFKSILEWWSNADKAFEPFDMSDIVKFAPVKKFVEFEDLYEEVPDVRIITAKEQWEKDSAGAETIQTLANGSVYKVAVTDGSITFFVYQDGEYFREIYPSFDELRKDAGFVMVYLSHVRCTHDTDMDAALAWLRGGEYTMSKLSLLDIYEIWECIDHLCYHDKEEPAAEVIKQDFKEEIDALRQKMIAHIIELCERGMTLNVEVLCQNPYLKYKGKCWALTENFNDAWMGKDEQGVWKLFWQDGNPTYEDELDDFSIDTLKDIIEALQ